MPPVIDITLPRFGSSGGGIITPPPVDDIPAGFIAEVATIFGGRTGVIPQTFWDTVAAQAADTNTHPSLGTTTHNVAVSGLWSSTSTWDTGTVPGANAVVNVGAGFTLTLDQDNLTDTIKGIHVNSKGTVTVSTTAAQVRMKVETVVCHGTWDVGTIQNHATGGSPRLHIKIAALANPGATTKVGLNFMGPLRMRGKTKAQKLSATATIAAGATSATFTSGSTSQWRVGEKVLFPATEDAGGSLTDASYGGPNRFYSASVGGQITNTNYNGGTAVFEAPGFKLSQDEVRTITAISGDVITWNTALTYDHKAYSKTLRNGTIVNFKPVVCMLTHSILIESDDPSGYRGHVMCMHNDDQMIDYVEIRNMGRSTTDPSLVIPGGSNLTDTNGGSVITNADNVRGRYPLHFHFNGPFLGSRLTVRATNVVVWSDITAIPNPGWGGIVHHGARADIRNCTIYNFRGAGLVTELGNEIGQWIDNVICWGRGDGYGIYPGFNCRAELFTNHNGHQGVGMECQSRQILCQRNLVTSCNYGAFYLQQPDTDLNRIPDEFSLRYADPLTKGYGDFDASGSVYGETYGVEQAQIPDWNDNSFFGCGTAFYVSHRQYTDRLDPTPMVSKRMLAINCDRPIHIPQYSNNYAWYDFYFKAGTRQDYGARFGDVSWGFLLVNGCIENYTTAISDGQSFLNYLGYFVDVDTPGCTNSVVGSVAQTIHGTPSGHAAYGIMGPWTTLSGPDGSGDYSVRTRTWDILNSATDLPVNTPASPYGPAGVEPSPGTPKPYFVDQSPDVSIAGDASVNLRGLIADSLGVRQAFDFQSAETNLSVVSPHNSTGRTGIHTSATDLCKRNGCWDSGGGVYKSRLWFHGHDRMTGDPFQYSIDVTLVGVAAGVLSANNLGAAPAKPVMPLSPEYVLNRAITQDTSAITVVTPSTATVAENAQLAITLQAEVEHPTWTITGGADSAKFLLDTTVVPNVLRWLADGTKDYEIPDDSGTNNVYDVQLTVADGWRTSTVLTLAVTVTNITESTPLFQDSFARGAYPENLETSPNWQKISGPTGAYTCNTDGAPGMYSDGNSALYYSPNNGSNDHYVQAKSQHRFSAIVLAFNMVDINNLCYVYESAGVLLVVKRVAGSDTLITAPIAYAGDNSYVIRAQIVAGVITVIANGVTKYTGAFATFNGQRCGLLGGGNAGQKAYAAYEAGSI